MGILKDIADLPFRAGVNRSRVGFVESGNDAQQS
jgi:hypothetical protein